MGLQQHCLHRTGGSQVHPQHHCDPVKAERERRSAKILDLAPGELRNLSGWKASNAGERGTLSGFPSYTQGGTWKQDGQTKLVGQKTVVIQNADGLYVLQLNADGLESQADILGPATATIDEQTKITG